MGTFQGAYQELVNVIEKKYEINLTLGEKVSLRECLRYSQENSLGKTLDDKFGVFQMIEAELMWLRQYGVSYEMVKDLNFNKFKKSKFKEDFKLIREESFLL